EVSLRRYLNSHGKDTNGTFDELVARTYVAHCENAPLVPTKQSEEKALEGEYVLKLKVGEKRIKDPLKIQYGWLKEKDAITKWPSMYYQDMSRYVNLQGPQFIAQLDREYKLGKAFRYFTDGLVDDILYLEIDEDLCFIKTQVCRSQAMRKKKYHVWAVLTKDKSDETPGGEILTACCGCLAGLGGMCNHLIGMLFKIENAVTKGLTKPSKTSQKSTWNDRSRGRANLVFGPVEEVVFQKSHYLSESDRDLREEAKGFRAFEGSLYKQHKEELKDSNKLRDRLFQCLKPDIPNSRFAEFMEEKPLNRKQIQDFDLPKTIFESKMAYTYNTELSPKENAGLFTYELKISKKNILDLSEATVGQGETEIWKNHRQGRMTASNFHSIFTKCATLRKNPETDCTSLTNTLLGKSGPSGNEYAIKHGNNLEERARRRYRHIMKSKHRKFEVKEAGLFLFEKHPFVGGSPDGLVSCVCCGEGVLEIKCPFNVRDSVPSHENVAYLVKNDTTGLVNLKRNHNYFFQIQGQLGVTGRKYCDFFVYTRHGEYMERIKFEPTLWTEILDRLNCFWIDHFCIKILLGNDDEESLTQATSGLKLTDDVNDGKKENSHPVQSGIPNKKAKYQ
uniref:YqaJ viral recombinase domain-containing protein n=2 Tax=Clytia hemisphaerica TaxID=252671 RepID=A0A7M5VBF9_9CNID